MPAADDDGLYADGTCVLLATSAQRPAPVKVARTVQRLSGRRIGDAPRRPRIRGS